MKNSQQLWIGLARVIPRSGNETLDSEHKGAMVNVIIYAYDITDFSYRLTKALDAMLFDLQELEDVEPYSKRVSEYEIDESLLKVAMGVGPGNDVDFGTFHTYPLGSADA